MNLLNYASTESDWLENKRKRLEEVNKSLLRYYLDNLVFSVCFFFGFISIVFLIDPCLNLNENVGVRVAIVSITILDL